MERCDGLEHGANEAVLDEVNERRTANDGNNES